MNAYIPLCPRSMKIWKIYIFPPSIFFFCIMQKEAKVLLLIYFTSDILQKRYKLDKVEINNQKWNPHKILILYIARIKCIVKTHWQKKISLIFNRVHFFSPTSLLLIAYIFLIRHTYLKLLFYKILTSNTLCNIFPPIISGLSLCLLFHIFTLDITARALIILEYHMVLKMSTYRYFPSITQNVINDYRIISKI